MPVLQGYEWTEKAKQIATTGTGGDYRPPLREEIEADKMADDPFAEWDWQNEQQLGPGGEALPKYATGWQPNGNADFGTGLSGWWNKAKSKVETAFETGKAEGLKISKLEKMNYAYDTPEEQAKLKEKRAESAGLGTGIAEAGKEVLNQALWGVLDLLSVPAKVAEQTIGAIGRTVGEGLELKSLGYGGVAEQLKRNYDASQLAYSAIFDMTVYTEMQRRMDQGVRPDLAAQEIMINKKWTLWPEIIGQGVLDPLNFVTVWTKAGQQIKLEKQAAAAFHDVKNPAIAAMLDATSKMDEAAAYRNIDEAIKTQQGLKIVTSHADDIAQSGKDLENLSMSYKMSSLTRDGKVANLANESSEILMHIVNNSEPDEAIEIIRGMVKSTSDDVNDAAEGITTMMHFADAPALFSQAGNKTTVLLSRMVEKYGDDWLKNIDALKNNPAELTKNLLGKLDEVGEEMFPSVSSMLEAEKAVKSATAGVELSEKTLALAKRAEQLPDYVKAATRFHDAAQKVVGPINKFFIGAYMGWSPGYAFRNFSNNSLQMLIDYGPGVLLGKADDVFAKAEKLHGGAIQGAFGFGGESASLFPTKIEGATDFAGAIDKVKKAGLKGPALGLAGNFETNAAKRVIAKTYMDTFERGTKAMVKALAPDLKAAGFSDDIIAKLPTYIAQHDGDAAKIIDALRTDIKAGTIDLFNDVGRIDPKYKKFMQDTGKWDEYSEQVLRAQTPEAAQAAAQKIFDDLAQAGDYVYREARPASGIDDQFLKMAEQNGGLPETRGELISIRREESRNAIKATEQILEQVDNLAGKAGLPVGTMKKEVGITGLNTWGNDAANESRRLNDLALDLYKKKANSSDLKSVWMGYPEFFPGTPPAGLTKQQFIDTLWQNYDTVVSKTWGGARDTAIGSVTKYMDNLKAAGVEVPDEWYQVIKEAQEGAQQWDTAVIGRFGEKVTEAKPLAAGTRSTEIAKIAQKYGVSSATEAGAPMDKKILNIINKYGDTNFKSLNDPIDLQLVEDAFKKRAGGAEDLTLYRGAPKGDAGEWFTPDMDAATEYSSLNEMGEVQKKIIKKGNLAEKEDILSAAKKLGIDIERESLYSLVSDQYPDIVNELRKTFDGIHLPKGEDFAPSGKEIESYRIFQKADAAPTPSQAADITIPEAKKIPRSELPEAASQRIADEAKRLRDELSGGEAGKRATRTASTNVGWYRELYQKGLQKPAIDKALNKIIQDQGKDVGINVERMKDMILDNFRFGDAASGTPPDLNILKLLGADDKTMAEALDTFNDITKGNYSLEDAIRLSGGDDAADVAKMVERDPDLPYFDDAGNLVEPRKRLLPPPPADSAMPVSRAIHEQMDDVKAMRQWVMDDISKNFGKKQLVGAENLNGLKVAEKELKQKLAETKLISSRVAQANRDFTLLNYGEKSYWDTALAYLYPFHFWYKGTYKNWLKRVAQNPSVLANYSRYKENLGTVHAGMPEWWKYNINTNDLPGIDVDNPMYFNLEATLWPLNGITGLDFNDSSKNVNWWTNTLSFVNKFGPSTWSPISMVTGLMLHQKGEQDAGDKWMGRLFPQSATIKAAGSLLGMANLETDPLVNLFQGGLDPYERRRAQRALANMMQDVEDGTSPYTKEQIQDAAYNQEGEIWEQAVKMSTRGRAPSQMSSFLFGVGFKGRTAQDQEIDKFYTDYNKLWAMRPNLSPQEFSQGMEQLKTKYDFMDTVLLSKRDGVERDAGLAYNVLTRIPPGKTSDIAKAVGVSPELLSKFFDDKGQIDQWSKADYNRLMAGVLDISAILEIPSDMTRKEWLAAKNTYKTAMDEGTKQFGDDIWDRVDGYYQAKTQSPEAADAYLQKHPEVQQALDWKSKRIMDSPILSAYYGGASVIESYYRSQMYSDIEKNLGKDIFTTIDTYNDLKTYGDPKEQKQFYRQHKAEITQYYKLKDQWSVTIDQNVARLASQIPDIQDATIRPDADLSSLGAQNLADSLQPEQQIDLQAALPQRLQNLLVDYFETGTQLPESADKQLIRLANELGYESVDDLIQEYGMLLYQP